MKSRSTLGRDFLLALIRVMVNQAKWDIVIIGGGLAGLTTALRLATNNLKICLIEKNEYPHHKVCGEYVNNEILPYLNSLKIDPFLVGAKQISKFQLTDLKGIPVNVKLPLGGFGLSRYAFDNLLFKSLQNKIEFLFDTVEQVSFQNNHFDITTKGKANLKASFVIGAFGKRSNIDLFLNRKFISQRSPWLAVKAHYDYDFPEDTVALHTFKGGYCGLSKTETNAVNACYLATFKSFKEHKNIETFQNTALSKNPYLKSFFEEANPIFEKPLSISQISFQRKKPVENHIFMIGDSAGLIHPLCGNGMAMAIRSSQIFSNLFLDAFRNNDFDRNKLELKYTIHWQQEFGDRLKTGRFIQRILMNPSTAKIGFTAARLVPALVPKIIEKTHGSPSK